MRPICRHRNPGQKIRGERRGRCTGIRLHHRRRRFGRLRAGQPADRGSARPRVLLLEAGGKDRDPWIHIPAGFFRNIYNPKVAWYFETEPVPEFNNRRISLAARQGARRLVVDQRPDLHPRPDAGFRPVAPARQRRLVVGRRAAVFPQGRAPGARRERIPRQGRPAESPTCSTDHPLHDAFIEAAQAGGLSVQPRLQRRRAGRRRTVAADGAQPPPLLAPPSAICSRR